MSAEWVGLSIGKYRIVRRIGRGGMGSVYEGVDLNLQRSLAIKLMPADPTSLPRLLREARAIARVNHPNVVSVYDVGKHAHVFYLVMELIRGSTAQQLVAKRGPLPWAEATQIAIAACRGLRAAHNAGIVHRDIKPANILCPDEGEPKLADFGLAKPLNPNATQITQANMVIGTPHYMSPEQCRCEAADERSDIYALGCVYYFLLTGRPPFDGHDRVAVLFHHCSTPPPPARQFVPDLPQRCVNVLETAMAKRRSDRYEDCDEFLEALTGVLTAGKSSPQLVPVYLAETVDGATLSPPPRPRRRRKKKRPTNWAVYVFAFGVGALGVGAAVLAGTAAASVLFPDWAASNPKSSPRPVMLNKQGEPPGGVPELPSGTRLNRSLQLPARPGPKLLGFFQEGHRFHVSIGPRRIILRSPDGRTVDLNTDDEVKAVVAGLAERWVAVAAGDEVSVFGSAGGPPKARYRPDAGAGRPTALASHGDRLAVGTLGSVQVADMSGQFAVNAIKLTYPRGVQNSAVVALAFSADGTRLVAATADRHVQAWDVASDTVLFRTELPDVEVSSLVYGPKNHSVLVFGRAAGRAMYHLLDPTGIALPRELFGPAGATAVCPTPGNRAVLVAGGGKLGRFEAFAEPQQDRAASHPYTEYVAPLGKRPVRGLSMSLDGKAVLCGYDDGSADLFGFPGFDATR